MTIKNLSHFDITFPIGGEILLLHSLQEVTLYNEDVERAIELQGMMAQGLIGIINNQEISFIPPTEELRKARVQQTIAKFKQLLEIFYY